MSPETFDFLVYASIAVGLVWAAIRLYQDLTRPLPEEPPLEAEPPRPAWADEDTDQRVPRDQDNIPG